ncbi:hypothetical protein D3C83_01740 [compost metagenome]
MTAPTSTFEPGPRSIASLWSGFGTGIGLWLWISRIERITPQFSHVSPGRGPFAAAGRSWRKSGIRMDCVKTGAAGHSTPATSRQRAASRAREAIMSYSERLWMKYAADKSRLGGPIRPSHRS